MSEGLAKKKGLGQGLSVLLSQNAVRAPYAGDTEISSGTSVNNALPANELSFFNPNQFVVGKYQARTHFDEAALEDLVASVKAQGVLHPLLARKGDDGTLELIAGERRLRAAQKAGLKEVPCRVLDLTEKQAFEIGLLENIQREDLSPMEEARGYDKLISEIGYTQEVLAEKLGKSRAHLANTLRLLRLPKDVQKLIDEGKLAPGAGRVLVGKDDAILFAQRAVEEGWSVRMIERYVQQGGIAALPEKKLDAADKLEARTEGYVLAQQLKEITGLETVVQLKKKGGVVTFPFRSPGELDQILSRLTHVFSKTA